MKRFLVTIGASQATVGLLTAPAGGHGFDVPRGGKDADTLIQ